VQCSEKFRSTAGGFALTDGMTDDNRDSHDKAAVARSRRNYVVRKAEQDDLAATKHLSAQKALWFVEVERSA
jgi:hypothetical protein